MALRTTGKRTCIREQRQQPLALTPVFIDNLRRFAAPYANLIRSSPNYHPENPPSSFIYSRGFLHLTPALPETTWFPFLHVIAPWTSSPESSPEEQTAVVLAKMGPSWTLHDWASARLVCKAWREHFTIEVPILTMKQKAMFFKRPMEVHVADAFWVCDKSKIRELHLRETDNLMGIKPQLCSALVHFSVHIKNTFRLYEAGQYWVPFLPKSVPRFTLILDGCLRADRNSQYYAWDMLSFHEYVTHVVICQSQTIPDLPLLNVGQHYSGSRVTYPRLHELALEGVTIYDLVHLLGFMPQLTKLKVTNTFVQKNLAEGLRLLQARAADSSAKVGFAVPPRWNAHGEPRPTELTDPTKLRQYYDEFKQAIGELHNPNFVFTGEDFFPERFCLRPKYF